MLTLILGGARSGKSDLAQRMARAAGSGVVYIATMEAGDDEMRAKIDAHRGERPAAWRTIEAPIDVAAAITRRTTASETIILDCVTMWVTNVLLARLDADSLTPAEARAAIDDVLDRTKALLDAIFAHAGDVIVVSNEVGMGLVPPYPIGRVFRDALGAVNRLIAARADCVQLVVAGLVLDVKAIGALPLDAFGEAVSR